MISPKSNDEQCFKWAVIAAFHHMAYIKHRSEKISMLQYYEKQCNWQGLEFLLATQKKDKFEKNTLTSQ